MHPTDEAALCKSGTVDLQGQPVRLEVLQQAAAAVTVFAIISSAAATVFAVIFLQPQPAEQPGSMVSVKIYKVGMNLEVVSNGGTKKKGKMYGRLYPAVDGVEDFSAGDGEVGVDDLGAFFLHHGDHLVQLERPLHTADHHHVQARPVLVVSHLHHRSHCLVFSSGFFRRLCIVAHCRRCH
ncbi:hypothetical protein EJB05_31943 [Eragrostis curvula]|uniref:Uncharacterized protein n=1 Tax=Eragrostis curvula TaxID=38414 RepID=A0A5J9UES8_9POAL|nr:hypothetical protein EJB05_31943 [Eragrostis curvula]